MRSFMWLGSASAFARLIDLGAIVAVLGLVSPEQIGEASLAWTVLTLSEPFASLGVSYGLLTIKRLDKLSLDTALWLSLFGGVCLSLLVMVLAPALGYLSSSQAVVPLVAVGALKLIPAAVAAVPQQRLARALRHREIAAASALATVSSAIARVSLAFLGYGAWAFVLSQIGYSCVLLAALWMLAPLHPRIRVDEQRTHELLTTGMPSTLSNALVQWARNVDYLFVGALLGMAPLGLYRVAFDLAMEPVIATGDVVARSATPTLRRLAGSSSALKGAFDYSIKLTLLTALPLALVVFVAAPSLLALVKDASFVPAASATRWLVVASIMRVLIGLYTPLGMALGRPGLSLRTSLEMLLMLSASLAICIWILGDALSIASAGVAWCAAGALSLSLTRLRFRAVLRALPA
jgi:O-antigen/teichoic acid export membrane protein